MNCRHTDIFSLGRCSSYPISFAIDTILEGERVIIFAVNSTPYAFDGRNRRFGCTRGDYMNWTAEKFLSLKYLNTVNPQTQGIHIHRPKF